MARRKRQTGILGFNSDSSRRRARSRRSRVGVAVRYSNWIGYIFFAIVVAVIGISAAISYSLETGNIPGIVVIVAIPLGIVSYAIYRIRRWRNRRRWLDGVEMNTIDRMTGREFEEACAEIFRRIGYEVEVTQQSRDHGADLILIGNEGRVVVQTKRQEGKVGNSAVQEIHAAKGFYKASRAIVLTNSDYSSGAVMLAHANDVELLARAELASLLAKTTNRDGNNTHLMLK